jgi:hypothetical protein
MDGPAADKLANGEVSSGARPVVVGDDTLPAVLRSFLDGVFGSLRGSGGDVLRCRAAAAGGVPELRAGPARVDREGRRPPRRPRRFGELAVVEPIRWDRFLIRPVAVNTLARSI